jgi:hypothetical protein
MKSLFSTITLLILGTLVAELWLGSRPGVELGTIGYVPVIVGLFVIGAIALLVYLFQFKASEADQQKRIRNGIILAVMGITLVLLFARLLAVKLGY